MIEKITSITICPDGGSMVSEYSTVIAIDDEGGGEFIRITQPYDDDQNKGICFTKEEWPKVKRAIEKMMKNCKD